MEAWVLSFYMYANVHFIPGIVSEKACRDLAAALSVSLQTNPVDASYVAKGKCAPYQMAVYK